MLSYDNAIAHRTGDQCGDRTHRSGPDREDGRVPSYGSSGAGRSVWPMR